MSARGLSALPLVVTFALSCSGSNQEAPASPEDAQAEGEVEETSGQSDPVEEASPEEEETSQGIPTECHDGTDPCTADPKWVKKVCQDVYPAVALYLFQPDVPFTKAYLSRKTRAVNASGGVTSGEEWLQFDEQVVLLVHREASTGGMQVSGAQGGFDAMRWDGSCVTLGANEVRTQVPPDPIHAHVPWRYLGDDIQDALKDVESVKEAYITRKQECRGVYSGSVSKKCVRADEALNEEIVRAVQEGEVDLPVPENRP